MAKKKKNYEIKRFLPHSNYIAFEILIKFLTALGTILLFQYKPYCFAVALFLIMIVVFLKLGVF
jgi:hypothetical protein